MKTINDTFLKRRKFLKGFAAGIAMALAPFSKSEAAGFDWEEYFQKHFLEMTKEEKEKLVKKLEVNYKAKYGKDFKVKMTEAIPNVSFGYALNLSKCIGCRKCVTACVKENNLSRRPQIQYIRVVRMPKGIFDLEKSEHYYEADLVPEAGYYYLPVQCQQCRKAPCIKVCPIKATWQEKDGIVVMDYNWCIGCKYCMSACPYFGRRFSRGEAQIPKEEINTNVHYLGNRPRPMNVVEKCTFCIQRAREGKYPACLEACPVGARKFGNLLDPESEIRQIIDNKRVFRLKEELSNDGRFYYFFHN
jgi:Fe-S-cluster-containing dehydrogenase component